MSGEALPVDPVDVPDAGVPGAEAPEPGCGLVDPEAAPVDAGASDADEPLGVELLGVDEGAAPLEEAGADPEPAAPAVDGDAGAPEDAPVPDPSSEGAEPDDVGVEDDPPDGAEVPESPDGALAGAPAEEELEEDEDCAGADPSVPEGGGVVAVDDCPADD